MTGRRRFLVAILTLGLLGIGPCDGAKVERWCGVYARGYAYVATIRPALDAAVAVAAPPAWAGRYQAATAALDLVHGRLTATCERYRAGQAVRPEDVAKDIGEAAALLGELIRLADEVRGTRAVESRGLLEDLAKVEAETRGR